MSGFNDVESAAVLDLGATNARYTHVGWSENGTTETANVARTAATWKAATVANPSAKVNNGALTSAGATAACTISHWAVFSAATVGVQRIDWTAVTTPVPLIIGGTLAIADGALAITLT